MKRRGRHRLCASAWSCRYPADVLALRSRGEGLGPDDGVAPHEGVLVDVGAPFLRPDHRAVMGRRRVLRTRLLVDLWRQKDVWIEKHLKDFQM